MSPFSWVRIFSLYVWLIDIFIGMVYIFYLGAHPSIVELSLFTCNAVSSLASESAYFNLNSTDYCLPISGIQYMTIFKIFM